MPNKEETPEQPAPALRMAEHAAFSRESVLENFVKYLLSHSSHGMGFVILDPDPTLVMKARCCAGVISRGGLGGRGCSRRGVIAAGRYGTRGGRLDHRRRARKGAVGRRRGGRPDRKLRARAAAAGGPGSRSSIRLRLESAPSAGAPPCLKALVIRGRRHRDGVQLWRSCRRGVLCHGRSLKEVGVWRPKRRGVPTRRAGSPPA